MLTNHIHDFFDNNIPSLKFVLAANCPVAVDIATASHAKTLAANFVDYIHPSILTFIDRIAETSFDDLTDEEQQLLKSDGYLRFLLYLTIYCNQFGFMVESHAISYLPKINLPLDRVTKLEYFPKMGSNSLNSEGLEPAFNGNVDEILLFTQLMSEHFIRVHFDDAERDISLVDILGYLGIES